jgi:hypothetical protein
VYFYRNTGYYVYDLTKLTDYTFWVSTPGNYPDFYYAHTIWQYSFEGQRARHSGEHGSGYDIHSGAVGQPTAVVIRNKK